MASILQPSSAYSFYLNLILLNNAPPLPPTENLKEPQKKTSIGEKNNFDLKNRLGVVSKDIFKGAENVSKKITKGAESVGKKAAAFVASKTVVSRTSSALTESIPEIVESMGLDIAIVKRFQQGNVFVLQVDLKPAEIVKYIEEVRGEESAEHYRITMSSLRFLGATDTIEKLEQEMLPKIRDALMEKLVIVLPRKIKAREGGLEIECIALDDKEQARWLFTFLEFQSQMK